MINKNLYDLFDQLHVVYSSLEAHFSKVLKCFCTWEAIAKSQTFHTRSFRPIHLSVFRYKWTKNGFPGLKSFQGFQKVGPWKRKMVVTSQIPAWYRNIVFALWAHTFKIMRMVQGFFGHPTKRFTQICRWNFCPFFIQSPSFVQQSKLLPWDQLPQQWCVSLQLDSP